VVGDTSEEGEEKKSFGRKVLIICNDQEVGHTQKEKESQSIRQKWEDHYSGRDDIAKPKGPRGGFAICDKMLPFLSVRPDITQKWKKVEPGTKNNRAE